MHQLLPFFFAKFTVNLCYYCAVSLIPLNLPYFHPQWHSSLTPIHLYSLKLNFDIMRAINSCPQLEVGHGFEWRSWNCVQRYLMQDRILVWVEIGLTELHYDFIFFMVWVTWMWEFQVSKVNSPSIDLWLVDWLCDWLSLQVVDHVIGAGKIEMQLTELRYIWGGKL